MTEFRAIKEKFERCLLSILQAIYFTVLYISLRGFHAPFFPFLIHHVNRIFLLSRKTLQIS